MGGVARITLNLTALQLPLPVTEFIFASVSRVKQIPVKLPSLRDCKGKI